MGRSRLPARLLARTLETVATSDASDAAARVPCTLRAVPGSTHARLRRRRTR